MIDYTRDDRQQTIPDSKVRIIGLGGAGANMLDRIAVNGMSGVNLLSVNTDKRTLDQSVAKEKIQIGVNLTRGLGCGGDPELGAEAVMESEDVLRTALSDQKIIFICVGLGGGTGSGAISSLVRIAREQGAFVVVFATMPFAFEGRRRLDQARTALNEVAALSNALVTFENSRMGELVLAKQGIHDAFVEADKMISESIRAVIRLVVRPGIINVGLDDLMTALRTTRSRCLFGSGLGQGENRSQQALEKSLASPLLDKGSLLKDAESVLVHICGGKDLTLYEVELLMRSLGKHVPEHAHILFGAAIDPTMNDSLSVTIISSLPEEKLQTQEEEAEATSTQVEVEEPAQETSPEEEPIQEGEEEEDNLPKPEDISIDFAEPEEGSGAFADIDPSEERKSSELSPEVSSEKETESPFQKEATVTEAREEKSQVSAEPTMAEKEEPKATIVSRFNESPAEPLEEEDLDIPPYLRTKRNS